MADNYVHIVNLFLQAGESTELSIPYNSAIGGVFARLAPIIVDGEQVDLINGFWISNNDIGTIEQILGRAAVTYTHKKAENNSIIFYARDEATKVLFNVLAVVIHDHSTITQGGPAYATYYDSDDVIT